VSQLLFDLTFVIAIAALTGRFAHALADGHALEELVPFLQVFFAVWWAWDERTSSDCSIRSAGSSERSVVLMFATPRVPVRQVPSAGAFGRATGRWRSTRRCGHARTMERAQC
jgi:hypothetical protein